MKSDTGSSRWIVSELSWIVRHPATVQRIAFSVCGITHTHIHIGTGTTMSRMLNFFKCCFTCLKKVFTAYLGNKAVYKVHFIYNVKSFIFLLIFCLHVLCISDRSVLKSIYLVVSFLTFFSFLPIFVVSFFIYFETMLSSAKCLE